MLARLGIIVAVAALLPACGESFRPVIRGLDPPNGASAVDQSAKPNMLLAVGASIELTGGDGRFVLFNVTGGARNAVGGDIVVEGARLTYEPTQPLPADSDFELVMAREAVVANDKLLDIDGSEFEEPLTWPYIWRFTTRTRAQVRAVYLDSGRIFVHFSQPMDQVATTAASFALFDEADKDVPISKLVWVGDGSARLEIGAPLDRTALYTLLVRSSAQAADGTALDGDGDGRPGETDDDYSVQFTGSQNIIKSRLGQAD